MRQAEARQDQRCGHVGARCISADALPAAALLASFIGTGSSFLAFAALVEKRRLTDTALPSKSFYFLGGLTEATGTIAVFAAMCV